MMGRIRSIEGISISYTVCGQQFRLPGRRKKSFCGHELTVNASGFFTADPSK